MRDVVASARRVPAVLLAAEPGRAADGVFRDAGRLRVVASWVGTKVQEAVGKVVPDRLKAEAHRKMAEPGSAAQ